MQQPAPGLVFTPDPTQHLRKPPGRQWGIAFAVPSDVPSITDRDIDGLFLSVIEATEEAIINSLFAAETVTGRNGHTAKVLPIHKVMTLMQQSRP